MSGIDKYVTQARPQLKPAVTLSSVSISVRDRKWIDIETQRSHDQKCYRVSKAMTRLLRRDQTVPREIDGAVLFDDVLEECRKKKFDGAAQWSFNDWISMLAKGGGAKKKFHCCLNPYFTSLFLCLRQNHGHSGDNAIDPEMQDNVLLPEGFFEYIYHVGNASEMNSTIRSGLIPGGRSLKRGRQSVFFTVSNPMEDDNDMEETPCDLTKPRLAPYKNTWTALQKYGSLVQFKARSQERIAILPNTVTCNRSLRHIARRLH